MTFARQEIREQMRGISDVRRGRSALLVAASAYYIVSNMVNDGVYAAAGLDTERALLEARNNHHHKRLMRSSCAHLMDFLADAGLLTGPAIAIYKRLDML